MAGLNTTARNAQLDGNSAVWPPDQMSLHNSDPGSGTSPTGGTELTGGSPAYARKALTWQAASGGSKTATPPTFDVPVGATPAAVGYWRGSTYLGSRTVATEGAYGAQGTYTPLSITESIT